ncbi:membrane protein [Rhizobiales bacterium GAS191]|nr:membrane protein [Rhizobiales bacterium GAS191]
MVSGMFSGEGLQQKSPRESSNLWTLILGVALLTMIFTQRPRPTSRGSQPAPCDSREPTDAELNASRRRALETGRGRNAESPAGFPKTGWKDILWRTWGEFNKDRVLSVAAGVTFYALLALFPAIAAFVSLYGLFADRGTIGSHLDLLRGLLPGGALDIVGDQVNRIAQQKQGALGFAFFFSLAVSIWSANAGMKALFEAMNVVYEEDEKRSFIALNLRSLLFTLAAIAFLILAVAFIVVVPVILSYVGFATLSEKLLALLRWPLLLLVMLLGLAVLYRYGPSRRNAEWKWVTWGSVLAAGLWLAGSLLFSWYVANFGNYNATYGSLGAAIGFMTWIWLSTIIILLGGELNAEMEHQTARDTTVGEPKPLGARGAHMADTVGASTQ